MKLYSKKQYKLKNKKCTKVRGWGVNEQKPPNKKNKGLEGWWHVHLS